MKISVKNAAKQLEERGLLRRTRHDHSTQIIQRVTDLMDGLYLPDDLVELYRECIDWVDDYSAYLPVWNDYLGQWRCDGSVDCLKELEAVPLFGDGCGNYFGLDVRPRHGTPAVYFFDATSLWGPEYAVGSSLGNFLLLLGDRNRAFEEKWPERWELKIDPDIDHCPRARAIWTEGLLARRGP